MLAKTLEVEVLDELRERHLPGPLVVIVGFAQGRVVRLEVQVFDTKV